MLDTSLSQTAIWKSIKKFYVDNFIATPVHFERVLSSKTKPSQDKWVVVSLDDFAPGHISESILYNYIFSKRDFERDELFEIKDAIMELVFPGSFPLYDVSSIPWEPAGAVSIYFHRLGKVQYTPDQCKMLSLTFRLKWASVWS